MQFVWNAIDHVIFDKLSDLWKISIFKKDVFKSLVCNMNMQLTHNQI